MDSEFDLYDLKRENFKQSIKGSIVIGLFVIGITISVFAMNATIEYIHNGVHTHFGTNK